ncbi:hypothetical protein [Kitasatospora sp. LaBMicrA B282]|uniref:hypothetical protein n=1 Tax=Kitasatospora sp. LaBMicrA B282 TaxID=3420949 RepID=UPI003D1137A7
MKSLVTAARWGTAALAAGALLATLGGAGTAGAAAPVSGTAGSVGLVVNSPVPVVSPDGTTAYVVGTDGSNTVTVQAVDTQGDTVTRQLGLGASDTSRSYPALSADGTRLYVLNGQRLSVVDTASLTLLAAVTLPDQPRPTGWTPGPTEGLVLSSDGSTVYVAQNGPETYRQYGQGRVLEFNTAQRAFTTTVQLSATNLDGLALRPNGHDLYVSGDNTVIHLNTAGSAPAVVGTIKNAPAAGFDYLAFSPDGSKLFAVSGNLTSTAGVIDPTTDTVTGTFTLTSANAQLDDPQVSPDGSVLYVTENDFTNGGSVLAVDTTTGAALPNDTVSSNEDWLYGMAVGPDNHTVYLTGTTNNNPVLEIDNY